MEKKEKGILMLQDKLAWGEAGPVGFEPKRGRNHHLKNRCTEENAEKATQQALRRQVSRTDLTQTGSKPLRAVGRYLHSRRGSQ